ncbi:trehalose-phosphatase [Patescibacteria group bacterium]|nr:trehalose-phosphatase [Patescibacteria group bacterium]
MSGHSEAKPGLATGSQAPLDAVLFDMDGVITDTAKAHAAAWKRLFDAYLKARADRLGEAFEPFRPERDYRQHVDGKPRYDGVKCFLASRGIELPYGSEDDDPDKETVCGLGNRKDRYFRDWLDENQVTPYPGTLKLIAALRSAGVRTAVFSASRNAEAVLRNAGVLGLFDAKVDGSDSAQLGLAGKPDPAMLREAAARLGAPPGRCAVVEDAIAGIEAGTSGDFGLVIGVDRGDYGEALRRAGAHLVVHDLSELVLTPSGRLAVKRLANLPSVWAREDEVRQRLSGKELAVFLDYDGTLTPIVEDHTKALLSGDMRDAVRELGKRCTVAIVSGRDLEMLQGLVELDSVFYAGSHGFEIAGPDGTRERLEKGTEFLPELDEAEHALQEKLAGIAGHAIERKRFSIAVHYRQVADEDMGELESALDTVLADHPNLQRGHGKKVFELRPGIDWNKGRAVRWLLEKLGLNRPDVIPLYIGDDVTDEDAFRALAGRGLAIAVRDGGTRQTAADYTVTDTQDVRRVIGMLTDIAAGTKQTPGAKR